MPLTVKTRFPLPRSALFRRAPAALAEAVFRPRLTAIVLRWERGAKLLTPVDTGLLRSSITGRVQGGFGQARGSLRGVLSTNVVYAHYVELGTRGRQGVRMLQRSREQLDGAIRSELAAGLGELAARLGQKS